MLPNAHPALHTRNARMHAAGETESQVLGYTGTLLCNVFYGFSVLPQTLSAGPRRSRPLYGLSTARNGPEMDLLSLNQ